MSNHTPKAKENSEPIANRLAFSVKETAGILGIGYHSVLKLNKRGLLRSSVALRTKIFSKSEIERFLQTTLPA
jgi:hypothetical protein